VKEEPAYWKSRLYIAAGFTSIGVGIIGIWTPLLPTTEFLLLASFFFARGSQRWHTWLMSHPTFSPYILAFREKRGLTREQKIRIIFLVSITMGLSVYFIPSMVGKISLLILWGSLLCFFLLYPRANENSSRRLPL
jgi:hypothetical protein